MALPSLTDMFNGVDPNNATLDQFNQAKTNYFNQNNNSGMDSFDSFFSGDPNIFNQNMATEQGFSNLLGSGLNQRYNNLATQDMNSGFSGAMRKIGPTLPLAILSGGLMAGGLGALGGGFSGLGEGGLAGLFGSAPDPSVFTNPAFVDIPGAAGSGLESAGMFTNPAFVDIPGYGVAPEFGAFNNPAFVNLPSSASEIASGATAGGVSSGNSVNDFFKSLTNDAKEKPLSTLMNGARTVSGLADLWSTYQQNRDYGNLAGNLMSMFGDDSDYAKQLRKELQRRDAASGRRSQYGPRAVELQARLAELNSRNAGTLANIYGMQGKNRDNMVKAGLNIGKSTGLMDWLDGQLSAPLAKLFGG